jgi:hypothetical protein
VKKVGEERKEMKAGTYRRVMKEGRKNVKKENERGKKWESDSAGIEGG